MKKRNDLEELWKKFLNKDCNPAELQEIFTLFGRHDEAELRQLIRNELDRSSDANTDNLSLEDTEVLDRLQLEISGKINKKPARKVISLRLISYVAASLMLFIGITILMVKFRNAHIKDEAPKLTSIYGDDILPLKDRATLTLSSGKSISLNEQSYGVTVSGDGISYENGDRIDTSSEMEYAELTTPQGGQYRITLGDGTMVSLNAGSSLRYPMHFNGDSRTVSLSGEAYFEVTKDAKKPFIVSTSRQQIKVLGTSFNVRAYNQQEVVTLASGKVSLGSKGTSQQTVIIPGQQAILMDNQIKVRSVDPDDFSAWKLGTLVGADMDFLEVASELERWYDVKFLFPDGFKNPTKAHLNIDMTQRLSVVLKYLGDVYDIKFQIKGKEVFIR